VRTADNQCLAGDLAAESAGQGGLRDDSSKDVTLEAFQLQNFHSILAIDAPHLPVYRRLPTFTQCLTHPRPPKWASENTERRGTSTQNGGGSSPPSEGPPLCLLHPPVHPYPLTPAFTPAHERPCSPDVCADADHPRAVQARAFPPADLTAWFGSNVRSAKSA